MFTYNVLILSLNWSFSTSVISLEIAVSRIRGRSLTLNVKELCIIIGGVLMKDLYTCLAVNVFPDPHGPIRQSSFPPFSIKLTPSRNAADLWKGSSNSGFEKNHKDNLKYLFYTVVSLLKKIIPID